MSQKEFQLGEFHLVLFDDGGTGVAPDSWKLSKKECWWPPKTSNITQLSSFQSKPGEKWTKEKMKIVRSFDTFKNAKKALISYEETSNFDTDDDIEKRKKRTEKLKRKQNFIEDTTDSEKEDEAEDDLLLTAVLPQKTVDFEDNFASRYSPKFPKIGTFDVSSPKVLNQNVQRHPNRPDSNTKEKENTPSCNCNCADFQRHVTRSLLQIRSTQSLHGEMLQAILENMKKNREEDVTDKPEENLFQLPCNSNEELRKLELQLSNQKDSYKKLVTTLKTIGGHNAKDCIKRMFRHTLVDFVAKEYSWIGGSGKLKFHCLLLSKAMFEAIRKNDVTKHVSDKDIEQAIKDHLRHAKARFERKNNAKPMPVDNATGVLEASDKTNLSDNCDVLDDSVFSEEFDKL